MKPHRFALLTAALLALGACSDPAAPAIAGDAGRGPMLETSSVEDGLMRVATARSNQSEPRHWDRTRFNITLLFQAPVTDAQREVFEVAAARWERIVIGDVPSISGTLPSCFRGQAPVATAGVDDILIQVLLVPIDGPGRVLGSAGPCFVRNADNLPVSGLMRFDVADIARLEARGLFDEVIVHEMGHVLGIGTLWNFRRALRQGTGAGLYFAGEGANVQWSAEGGEGFLPIENLGGPGTAGGHWREGILRNELMTGFLNLGENPLSRITAASLRDMGYRVGVVGERYALARGSLGVFLSLAGMEEGLDIAEGEELIAPIGVVPSHDEP